MAKKTKSEKEMALRLILEPFTKWFVGAECTDDKAKAIVDKYFKQIPVK